MNPNLSTLNGRHFKCLLLLALSFLCCSWLGMARADQTAAPLPALTLFSAELTSLSGKQMVELPHILQSGDFNPKGDIVHYRLVFELAMQPDAALGVFVSKLSLSGRLSLNGQEVGTCAVGRLQDVRCLHQPNLFVPPKSLWRAGLNTLEFEIYANDKQVNGLTPVLVGDAFDLSRGPYLRSYLLKQEIGEGMVWLSFMLGLISLAVAIVLRSRSLYFWFGLTCLINALVNINFLVTYPLVNSDFFSWLSFSSRLLSIPLLLLTFLSFFTKEGGSRWLTKGLVAYMFIGPALVALMDSSRMVVIALYVPLMLAALGIEVAMVRWSWRSRRPLHVITTLILASLLAMGLSDWMRLAGRAPLDGVYLIGYGYSGVMLIVGTMLLSLFANALRTSRELSATLEARVAETSALLNSALQSMSQGICVIDKSGHFKMFNDKACDLLDLPRSLLESKPLLSEVVKFQSDRGDFGPEFANVESTGRSYVATLGVNVDLSIPRRYLRQDKSGRYIEVNTQAMPSGDVVRTYTDVSEYEQVNRQLKVMLDEYQQLSDQVLQRGRDQVVVALTELSVIRDNETGLHTKRTQLFVKTLAQALVQSGHYEEHLSEQQIDLIVKATPMHDLGKIGIPDHILLKPGRLTDEEMLIMRTHAALGESILLVMAGAGRRAVDSVFTVAAELAGAHHENWDGSGYPRGQSAQDIPLSARLMAVADVYDALTTARVYKRAWSHEEATAHIASQKGKKFDPVVVDAFEREEANFKKIALELADH
jgi:HD-GYP domain-containing protein (c-di-GMP phosphodiesterase class II)